MIEKIKKVLSRTVVASEASVLIQRRSRYEELLLQKRRDAPRALSGFGYKVFSQSDEDGIIAEIFRRIGVTNRQFVEFGVGDGLENNTLALLYDGWSGLWIDGSDVFCQKIRDSYNSAIKSGYLRVVNSFITTENIDSIIASEIKVHEIDLLSVDIDGNDAHVYNAITCISPRVIVFEYNAKFGPSIDYCMAYDPNHVWRKSDRFGASLKHFENLLQKKGYSCVGCNLVGTNAFFVRNDLVGDNFEGPFTSEAQFEPARYELAGLPSGHPPIHATFSTRLNA